MSDSETAAERGIGVDVVHRLRTEMGESDESIRAMPDATLQRAIQKLEHPDRARRRVEFELAAIRDDAGDIADGAVRRALEQASDLRSAHPAGQTCGLPTGDRHLPTTGAEVESTSALLPETAGLTAIAGWNEIGPDNIGGRTRAIVIDPDDTARIFAGSAGGGVWRSTDTGSDLASRRRRHGQPRRVLDGDQPGCSQRDAGRHRRGIPERRRAARRWCLPNRRRRLHVGAHRVDRRQRRLPLRERSRRTPPTAALVRRHPCRDLPLDRRRELVDEHVVVADRQSGLSPDRFVTGDRRTLRSGATSGAALFTVDGGLTWTTVDHAGPRPWPGPGLLCRRRFRRDVCVGRHRTVRHLAVVRRWPDRTLPSSALSGGGPASFLGQQGWYDNVIWAGDPIDSDLVVVGGIDLWRSTDGGDHLVQISTWWSDDSAHADHHTIVSDPGYDGVANRRAYFGNDGGVYRAVDVTTVGNNASPPYNAGWNHLDGGYAVTQFYYGAGHVGTNSIVGGTQDNGTLRYTPASGTTWNRVYGGDGGACASDPTDPQTWYGEYVFLQVFRNSNGGASSAGTEFICGRHWNGARWVWKPEPFTIPDARDSERAVHRAVRARPERRRPTHRRWPVAVVDIRSQGAEHADDGSVLAVDQGADRIDASSHDHRDRRGAGRFRCDRRRSRERKRVPDHQRHGTRSDLGPDRRCRGGREQAVSRAGDRSRRPRRRVRLVRWVPAGQRLEDDDGGASWADISAGLPAAPARVVTLHPQRSSWVYLGTDVGVFASEDGGRRGHQPTRDRPMSQFAISSGSAAGWSRRHTDEACSRSTS